MRGSMEGLSQAPWKGPKDTDGFPSRRELGEAASGGTRALEHVGLGSNLSSSFTSLVIVTIIVLSYRALLFDRHCPKSYTYEFNPHSNTVRGQYCV